MTDITTGAGPESLPGLEAMLAASPALLEMLPSALLSRIGNGVEYLTIDQGATLIAQGEATDDLYVVLDGALRVLVERADRTVVQVDEVGPADIVGEMALLTRQPRTATVVALKPTVLLRVPRDAFDKIVHEDAQSMHPFVHRVLHRLHRTQLVKVLTDVLGVMDDSTVREIEKRLEWLYVPSGTRLFAEQEAAEGIYVVVNGRLRITRRNTEGEITAVEEAGHGSVVGDVAFLTDSHYGTFAEAIRDSHVLRIPRPALNELLERQPGIVLGLARAALRALQREDKRTPAASHPATYALVAATPDVPLDAFAEQLTAVLGSFGSTARLRSQDVDDALLNPGIAQAQAHTVASEALTAWLSRQEREHSAIVLQADARWSSWTRRCVLHADRIVIVATASSSPAPQELEQELRKLQTHRRTELVLLHAPQTTRPTGTHAWLAARDVAAHHHVRLGCRPDVERVARHLSGRPVGLVLGGGGARGFAHVGVLRAVREAGIDVDIVGGTSIGALIAGCIAADLRIEDINALAQTFASPRRLLDRTLPVAALMAGAKVTALYQRIFGDIAIEDLWTPYFAMSSGLSRAAAVVHQRGAVWRAVRASTAIPAIFPPLLGDDDEVHVDGGVMNNMPLDVMRQLCQAGTVIAVNPMPPHDRLKSYRFGPSLSGWHALAGRLGLFGSRIRAPSILGSVMRATEINSAHRMRQPAFRALADLLIEPPVGNFPILAFDRYAEIVEVGYRSANESIRSWQAAAAHEMGERAAANVL